MYPLPGAEVVADRGVVALVGSAGRTLVALPHQRLGLCVSSPSIPAGGLALVLGDDDPRDRISASGRAGHGGPLRIPAVYRLVHRYLLGSS